MSYCRNCPDCSKELCTENKYYYTKAVSDKKKCLSCSLKGKQFSKSHIENLKRNHADFTGNKNPFWKKKHTPETLEKLSVANKGKDRFSKSYKKYLSKKMKGIGNPFYGKLHTDETKQKLSKPKTKEHRKKLSRSLKGKYLGRRYEVTPETRKKMRLSAINRLKKVYGENFFMPNVNKKETDFFHNLEKQYGWDGIYFGKDGNTQQHYINSLGYWVDFYDEKRNIVVEYDETNHYDCNWNLRNKDLIRQNEIITELKCDFYRYNEVLDEFKKYT